MDISELATSDRLTLALAEVRGEVKITRLKPSRPRRDQLVYTTETDRVRERIYINTLSLT